MTELSEYVCNEPVVLLDLSRQGN